MRSSSEWNDTTTRRPPGFRMRSAAQSAPASSTSSSFTKMRSAWKVRVAGWIWPGRACTMRSTIADNCLVVTIGASLRARTIARAIGAGEPLLAEPRDDGCRDRGRSQSRSGRRRSVRLRPCACRAGRHDGTRSRARPRRVASTTPRHRAPRRRRCRDPRFAPRDRDRKSDPRPASGARLRLATRSAPRAIALGSRSMPITLQSAASRIARV